MKKLIATLALLVATTAYAGTMKEYAFTNFSGGPINGGEKFTESMRVDQGDYRTVTITGYYAPTAAFTNVSSTVALYAAPTSTGPWSPLKATDGTGSAITCAANTKCVLTFRDAVKFIRLGFTKDRIRNIYYHVRVAD